MTDPRRSVLPTAERAADALELFSRASAGLRRLVPFDSAVWTAADPETGLITAPMLVENAGLGEGCAAYWESELLEENVLPFSELARAAVPAAGLRAATGDLPARSARFRRLLLGEGVHDELRAVLRVDGRPWGLVSLFRTADSGTGAFRPDEVALLADQSRPLATRLRTFARPTRTTPDTGSPAPGLILFDASGQATSINEQARQHLSLLPEGPSFPSALGLALPIWLIGTALQARAIADGRDHGDARMRIQTTQGRWLICHASCLTGPGGRPGPVALVIEPAAAADLAVLIAQAYGLTSRELQITQLIARGVSTAETASTLFISPHTVRDHLKTIFTKTQVTSRGELVARLFTEHYWPALPEPTRIQHLRGPSQ
ncbi:LuxR C-terminal-related transcriptional regulator [Streptomyces lasiicapitis]|uniref:LuxR C-terminal-related transcriptional regulator n=1 Tax=Streptomyces lasiicapitis TaxID=1923961 RepID=UPI003655553B